MSGLKATPGPWYAEKLHTVFSVQSAAKSIAVCSRQGRAGRDGTAEANARLIAAAPSLYEALDALHRAVCAYEEREATDADHQAMDDALLAAETALARARGEQP